ncbi:hypothetical protein RclHR1_26190003 [Rhizophagus clarus]|uniref:Uncharacterized protein n=1 Tax=Rhizophagus clarus TaxID=94130 RepID=A0A2Z6RE09_9GLOM|nr:hypothetical protein RclHR1_26190003 [Rhizophagus clarus]
MKRKLQNIINTVLLVRNILKQEEFAIFLSPKLAPFLRQHGHKHFATYNLSGFHTEITNTIKELRSIINGFISNTGIIAQHYFHSHTSDLLARLLRYQRCLEKLMEITPDPVCRSTIDTTGFTLSRYIQGDADYQNYPSYRSTMQICKLHENQNTFKKK